MKLFLGVGDILTLVPFWEDLQVLYKLVARQQLVTWTQNVLLQRKLLFIFIAPNMNLFQNFFRMYVILTR